MSTKSRRIRYAKITRLDNFKRKCENLSEDEIIELIKHDEFILKNLKNTLLKIIIAKKKYKVVRFLLPYISKDVLNDIFLIYPINYQICNILLTSDKIDQCKIDEYYIRTRFENTENITKYKPSQSMILNQITESIRFNDINLFIKLLQHLDKKYYFDILLVCINYQKEKIFYLMIPLVGINIILQNNTNIYINSDLNENIFLLLITYGWKPSILDESNLTIQWEKKKLMLEEFKSIINRKDDFNNILFAFTLLYNSISFDILKQFYEFLNFDKLLFKII